MKHLYIYFMNVKVVMDQLLFKGVIILPLLAPQTGIARITGMFPLDISRLLKNLLKLKYNSREKHILNIYSLLTNISKVKKLEENI